jgi:PAS domain S-box-containing protein
MRTRATLTKGPGAPVHLQAGPHTADVPQMTRMVPSEASALHESDLQLRYRTLLEQVPAIVYTELVDPSTASGSRVTFMSARSEDILGYSPQEFIDDPGLWERILHVDDAEGVLAESATADETGAPFDVEYRMLARDGTVRWVRDVSRLVEGEEGRFWHGVLIDITGQQQAIQEARDAELRYQSLVETLPAVVFIDAMDDSATNIYTSPQTYDLLGYTVEDWIANPDLWWTLVHPDDVERITAAQERHALLKDHVFDEEYRMIRRDGRVIWVRDIASTVFDEYGVALFAQGLLMDVSARKEAEKVLETSMEREREAAEQLRALDRSRSALLLTLSHDLREPVTAFIGGTTALEQHGNDLTPTERADILGAMRERAMRMNEVITHLLDLDKLGEEVAQTSQHRVDLCALVDQVRADRGIDTADIEMRCEAASVWADPDAIRAILTHILDNAERHAPDSTVRLTVAKAEGGAEIIVEDGGPGIQAGMHESIFEPFRQGDTEEANLGMGVGLAYAQRHAELQGGRIRSEHVPGGGARFVVFLPA